MEFTGKLLEWYHLHKRDLPWRHTSNPYYIWLSEIILQQTRIDQGLPYYTRFIDTFPTVYDLAKASEQEVLKLWQGLGYYSRARNLHAAAREIVLAHQGEFPNNYHDILSLKGIGTYTASAIASIAFRIPVPVVDGNVLRFLTRYFGIMEPIDSGKAKAEVSRQASELIDTDDPGSFNQALMEFGAKQCIPRNPECSVCIFQKECFAFNRNLTEQIPVKGRKTAQRIRYFNYLVIRVKNNSGFYLDKREQNDIWKNLYTFPLIETGKAVSPEKLRAEKAWKELFINQKIKVKKKSTSLKHILTHQLITARFIEVEIEKPLKGDFVFVEPSSFDKFPLPRLIEKYLQQKIIT